MDTTLLVEKSEFNSLEQPNWNLMDYDINYERGSESTVDDSDGSQYDSADDDCTTNADSSVASHEDNGSENITEVSRPDIHPHLRAHFSEDRAQFTVPYECSLVHPESQNLNFQNMRLILKKILPTEIGIKCYLSFYGERHNKECSVMYVKCKYVECSQRFKFDITNCSLMSLTVFVYSTNTSKEAHPADMKLYYPLRGEERKNTQAKLATMTPRQFEMDAINAVDVELVRAGNMQELRSLHVYQKAKSEVNCQYDLTLKSLDLQDLIQLRVNERSLSDPYLRHASDLNATMFSEETCNDNPEILLGRKAQSIAPITLAQRTV